MSSGWVRIEWVCLHQIMSHANDLRVSESMSIDNNADNSSLLLLLNLFIYFLKRQTHWDMTGVQWNCCHGWRDFRHGRWHFHHYFYPVRECCSHSPTVWLIQKSSWTGGCLHQQNSALSWPQGTSSCTGCSLRTP